MRLLFSIVFFLVPNFVLADGLWQKTKYGMTPDQVREVVPNVQEGDPANTAGDLAELLKLNGLVIADTPFKVSFYFQGNKLDSVYLTPVLSNKIPESKYTFNKLKAVLMGKYGENPRGDIMSADEEKYTWISGSTSITLHYFSNAISNYAHLQITYRGVSLDDSAKL